MYFSVISWTHSTFPTLAVMWDHVMGSGLSVRRPEVKGVTDVPRVIYDRYEVSVLIFPC